MGKTKRLRHAGAAKKSSHKLKLPTKTVSKLPLSKPAAVAAKKALPRQRAPDPIIPFEPTDHILLIGEGDLSFAVSLLEAHECANVTASVLEGSVQELSEKYPQAVENLAVIEEKGGRVVYGVDATKMGVWGRDGSVGGGKRAGGVDRVVFNFPHVGGKSTDVNRQVRYNQELLVSFFKRALPSLAPGGSIIVTLFEGEPYTLWNIRDLARHSGLQVERSFKFQASAYPGYHHARTLGVVKSKTGESGAGWKGEDRPARSYIFVRKGDVPPQMPSKRNRNDDDSSDAGGGD